MRAWRKPNRRRDTSSFDCHLLSYQSCHRWTKSAQPLVVQGLAGLVLLCHSRSAALSVLLQRCSTNLNQYAKRANETGSVYAADIEDLRSRLDEIWELSRQSLARLANIR